MTKSRTEIGRSSRRKGKVGEREIVNALKAAGFEAAHRSAQYCGNTGDAPDVEGLPGVHIEVKRVERLNLRKAYEQAVNDSKKNGDIPAVFHRQSCQPWMVTVSLYDFLKICEGGIHNE